MKALTFQGKATIGYETCADPEIAAPDDVIVKTRLTAVCGSDLHVYHERETGIDAGTIMGHELVGEVVEVGAAVKSLDPGTPVVSPFSTNCGDCFYCRKGFTCRCPRGHLFGWVERGVGLQGTQAEYVRVPLAETTLLRVPEGVSDEEALLLGDVLSTGFFCAEAAEVGPETTCAVIGCGPVGLMAILGARERGATTIFAVDGVPERLELAQRFGAVPVDVRLGSAVDSVRERTEGRGADAVLEVVGSPEAARLAVDLVRDCGIVSVAGVHSEAQFAFSPAEAYRKNLTYTIGRCPARYYMGRLLGLVQQKKYDFQAIVSHRLPLAEGARAYRMFDRKEEGCTKVVLWPL